MNGLEAAIKSALARADRTNAEVRARIYQSARHALETGLRKQNISDPEFLAEQRHRLEVLIHAIEQQERAALAAAEAAAAEFSLDLPYEQQPVEPAVEPQPEIVVEAPVRAERDLGPSLDGLRAERDVPARPGPLRSAAADDFSEMRALRDERPPAPVARPAPPARPAAETAPARRQPVVEPPLFDEAPAPASAEEVLDDAFLSEREEPVAAIEVRADPQGRGRKRRRGFFSRLFILAVVLASLTMAGWWVYSSGLLLTASERDTSVPNPPPSVESEDFSGTPPKAAVLDPQQGFSDDWITVFEPGRIAELRPHRNAQLDVVKASDGNAVRLTSKSADDAGAVEIPFPVTVMREMAGKTSTIALTMQSPSDKPVQVAVDCDFNLLGSCARHRVTVNPEKSDVLIRVAFDRAMAPSKPGMLVINGDVTGHSQPVRLFSVRVLPGQ